MRRGGLRLVGVVLALAAACVANAQAAKEQVAKEQVARPGYSLQATRQGGGAMTVVFESGFGQGQDVWEAVIAELGAGCRCITYERAGQPKSIEAHVQDLGAVIDALVPGRNIVLVGHSYGGLLATEYARQHADRLVGLVLVDPAIMSQRHAFRRVAAERIQADDAKLLSMLPPAMGEAYSLLISQLDSAAAAAPRSQPDVPLALLTSTEVAADPFVFEETTEGKALWKRQHAMLFAEYARGSHRYFSTGHNIHRDNARAVADAIRSVGTDTAREK